MSFLEFVSNPHVQDGSLGHRARPSLEEIDAFIAAYQGLPKEEKQTHLWMQTIADEAEANVVLSMLAGESSESIHAESVSAATGRVFSGEERVCSPGSARRKRTRRAGSPFVSTGMKRRKRKLWHSSGLELEADSAAPDLGGDPASADLEDDIESCGGIRAGRHVSEEEEVEEEDGEDVPPLVCRNRRSKASNDVPIQALSGLVSLHGMTMSAIDHALEEIIPEGLLLEPSEAGCADIRIEVLGGAPSASLLAGQEITQAVSHASSTFEGGLICEDTLVPEVTHEGYYWGLVLKCYELRTRQHKMLNNNALRPLKHYFPKDMLRTKVIMAELRRLYLRSRTHKDNMK
jgi:hypothetical protein